MGWSVGLVLLVVVVIATAKSFIEDSYEIDPASIGVFENAVINTEDQRIFVGAVNKLYEFDSNLNVLTELKTGPEPDNIHCPIRKLPCDLDKVLTDGHSKAVLIDYDNGYLIYCTSLFQGICYKHNLTNIKQREEPIYTSIVANNATATTFAFIASGVIEDDDYEVHYTKVLNIGVQYTNNGYRRDRVPCFASRRLDNFEIAREGISLFSTKTMLDSSQRLRFPIKYVYGFSSEGFSYMITVQKISTSSEYFISKIFRVCQKDKHFYSYVELQLECRYNGALYNLAQAAFLGKAGHQLAKTLSIPDNEDVLYVSFSIGEPRQLEHASDSALCIYPMRKVRSMFTYNIQECFKGNGNTGPAHFFGSSGCKSTPNLKVNDSYCGEYEEVNSPLDGIVPVKADAATIISKTVTALTVDIEMDYTVAFAGTKNGHIIKVALETQTMSRIFDDLVVAEGSEIKPSLFVLPDQQHLFVLTDRKIFRFLIHSCEVYESCSKCVSSKDPQGCGWCGGRCSKKDECVDPNVIWSHDICTPVITSFEPVSGPTGGGTLLTIKGDNFGYKIPLVRIGDSVEQCTIQTKALSNTQIICKTHTSDLEGTFSVEVKMSDLSMEKLNYKVDGTFKTSDLKFEYRTPKLTSVFPLYGPRSGGTLVTLTGDNFNVGLNLSVSIGNLPCDIKSVNKTTLLILTTPAPRLLGSGRKRAVRKDFVILTIDGQTLYSADNYEYREDATVISITPSTTIYSGGTRVTVVGTNLDAVQRPKIGVLLSRGGQTAEDDNCTTDKADVGKKMICVMPEILPLMTRIDQSQLMPVSVYFVMDGIEWLRNLKDYDSSLSSCVYNPNPSLHKFEEADYLRIFDIANDYLEIKGEALTMGLNKDSYHVIIGRNTCYVTFVGERQLHCVPERPKTVSDNEPKQAVVVHIGRYLHFVIGYLQFTTVPTKSSDNIGVIVVVVVVPIGLAIIVLCIIMKKRKMGLFRDKNAAQFRYTGEDQRLMEQNRQNSTPPASLIATAIDEETRLFLRDQKLLIDRQYLEMGELLGAGHFGSVFKGYLTFPDVKRDTLVAVKTLHQNSPRQIDVQAFLKEALIMKDFNHPHVLNLIGICLGMDDMPLVVLPYMKHGDLLSYIRDEHNSPTIKDLITFGIGIALGMAYLSELRFVHRDLACRNCMLDENYQCKVADFGLSRDIYEKDYYASESKKTMLPLKWMALECLEKGKYSTKSDVWSYGIVLWELMTRGVNPYPDVHNWDIVRFLKHGRRMPQPQYCPDLLYAIMRKCWHPNPKERPTFSQLVHEVTDMITMIEQAMKQGQHTADIQTTYVNMENCTDYHYTDELMPAGSITYDDDSSAPTSPTSPGGPNSPVVKGTKSPVSRGATGTSEDLPVATSSNHDTKGEDPEDPADISHPNQDTKGKRPVPKPKQKTPKKPTTAKTGTPPTVNAGKKVNTEKSETTEKDDDVFNEPLVSSNGKRNEEESIS